MDWRLSIFGNSWIGTRPEIKQFSDWGSPGSQGSQNGSHIRKYVSRYTPGPIMDDNGNQIMFSLENGDKYKKNLSYIVKTV